MGRAARQSGIAGGGAVARATAAAEAWATSGARAIGVVAEAFTPYLVSLGVPDRKDQPRPELDPPRGARR